MPYDDIKDTPYYKPKYKLERLEELRKRRKKQYNSFLKNTIGKKGRKDWWNR